MSDSPVSSPAPRPFVLTEYSLLLRWPPHIDPGMHARILATRDLLRDHFGDDILDLVPTYSELGIHLRPPLRAMKVAEALRAFAWPSEPQGAPPPRQVTIPVCYEPPYAPDLPALAERHGCSPADIVERHTAPLYRVYFLGFLPGFAYLGGMDPSLATPRLPQPRPRVEEGSVGIAGAQTGVYPSASPGGWNLIGRTPLTMFRAEADGAEARGAYGDGQEARGAYGVGAGPPGGVPGGSVSGALLRPGDEVRFVAIDGPTFAEMSLGTKGLRPPAESPRP
jgi:inhibitor of KinA